MLTKLHKQLQEIDLIYIKDLHSAVIVINSEFPIHRQDGKKCKMNAFNKILLDVHPDAIDLEAVDHAAKLAIKNRATVKVLHVVEDFPEDLTEWWNVRNPVELMGQIVSQRQTSVDNIVARLKRAGVERIESGLRWGREVEEITQEVVTNHQELVMTTGTRAKGWLSRLRGGCSCIASLCRHCPSAIWVTRNRLTPLKRIVVALGAKQGKFHVDSLDAKMLTAAATLAEVEGSELHVLHAFPQKLLPSMKNNGIDGNFTGITDGFRQEIKEGCDTLLQDISLNQNYIHLVMGSPAIVIQKFVHKYGMDLVVMGTVGPQSIREKLNGNTSEKVMNGVSSDVLIVKPDTFATPTSIKVEELGIRRAA